MKKIHPVKYLCIILALIMALSVIPVGTISARTDYLSKSYDILNNVKLYPQKTGFIKMDNMVENFLNGLRPNCASTADLVKAVYDWMVANLSYKLGTYYPTYDYNSRSEIPIPFYVLYFGYCALAEKTGVCDNFSSAFMIIMRAIGLDAYIRTGKMYTSSTTYDHVWVEVLINGKYYVFDPQVENFIGTNRHSYFCVPKEDVASTYVKNEAQCAAYDAATVPVSETRIAYAYVGTRQSYGGTVKTNAQKATSVQSTARVQHFSKKNYGYKFDGWLNDTAVCRIGATVTVTAVPDSGYTFLGWYVGTTLKSTSPTYSFTVYGDTIVEALFSGDRFGDVAYGKWYYEPIYYCYNNGLMNGKTAVTFSPNTYFTRAMAVTVLAKMSNDNLNSYANKSSFADVSINSYYAKACEWAYQKGITAGTGSGFSPNQSLTREQLVLFIYKYCQYKKTATWQIADISGYWDYWNTHTWARDAMSWAIAVGLISGTSEHYISPNGTTTRAQAATILQKLSKLK